MIFSRYDFHCTLLDNAILPPFKGSTFRGGFGGALKRVVCAVREQDCAACLLAGRCVYARTFEISTCGEGEKRRTAATPHPYVIEPPLTGDTRFAKGEPFNFALLLLGAANEWLLYFIYAFELMGEGGIGKRVGGKRASFRLDRVLLSGSPIFDVKTRRLQPVASPEKISLAALPASDDIGTLEVRLLTPLRLKFANSFAAELPFHFLVRAMLRRISSLFAAYGDGEPALDYRGIVAAAERVETVRSHLHWHDWERWSGRQEQTMLMGGLMGSIVYRGRIATFLPLLELSRELHLGKQTSFGLGKMEYSWSVDRCPCP